MRVSIIIPALNEEPNIRLAAGRACQTGADEVIVVDGGRIVERGPHSELVDGGGVYSNLHASWVAQQGA